MRHLLGDEFIPGAHRMAEIAKQRTSAGSLESLGQLQKRQTPAPGLLARTGKQVWEKGLDASFRGGTLLPVAERIIEIAEGGLERRARLSSEGKDERVHLLRLKELVGKGQCPADALLEGLDASGDLTAQIIARTDLAKD